MNKSPKSINFKTFPHLEMTSIVVASAKISQRTFLNTSMVPEIVAWKSNGPLFPLECWRLLCWSVSWVSFIVQLTTYWELFGSSPIYVCFKHATSTNLMNFCKLLGNKQTTAIPLMMEAARRDPLKNFLHFCQLQMLWRALTHIFYFRNLLA